MTISIRALYENYKFKFSAPVLPPWPREEFSFVSLKDLCARKVHRMVECDETSLSAIPSDLQSYIKSGKICSVCDQ
jgi:hypothetical protein